MPEYLPQSFLLREDFSRAYAVFEQLLSTRKARECLKNAEESLAFDIELFMQPVREDLAECFEVIAGLIRERGTSGDELQKRIPPVSSWLSPAEKHAREIARLEKQIAEFKRNHPDFIFAFKLQVLIRKYEEQQKDENLDAVEYDQLVQKLDQAKRTLSHHMQTKVRIAQKAYAPDLLELAQWQLKQALLQEKVLRLKEDLLLAAQSHAQNTLNQLAAIFENVEPELADAILAQTQSLTTLGTVPDIPPESAVPRNLDEFRQALNAQKARIEAYEERLKTCRAELEKLIEFENAIFNTYGEQLRARGLQFQKPIKVTKSGTGKGPKPKEGTRMVFRR
ncbi:MAG TPA: hypothetical protein PLH79_09475 [bacterium]|nr:hypothetical protein [Candidatus Omnitrophota bacterium]HOL94564.1 hypothetical protein [bacterium]HPP02000.1 hypothetical protein [bacterium]